MRNFKLVDLAYILSFLWTVALIAEGVYRIVFKHPLFIIPKPMW